MRKQIQLWMAQGSACLMAGHVVVAVGRGIAQQSFDEGVAAVGACSLGIATIWGVYATVEACLWLRRKQIE